MAKNKIKAKLEVDDNGNLKKLAKDSNKAGKGLGNVAKNARTADRNIKGAAASSANGTKNFSKMAQGTGGLVGAYATLAANIFAITAAFSFLKSAADFRVVQESQIAFTGATGVGMRTLTSDIQLASESMLNFQAASEAASIGIASGLSSGQITELAEGASNLSKILGRDVTDSFNRLIRGVTKAEPELLDELGITLRLADAQENYAAKLKKSAKDLSNFEKKQAVFNEVSTQIEEKFNAVADATDTQASAINKLAVAFDEVLKPIKSTVAFLAEPVAEFFAKNVRALAVALALLAVPLIKQIIPGLTTFAAKAEESAQRASDAFKRTKADIDKLAQARANAGANPILAGQQALKGVKTAPGTGAAAMQAGERVSKRQLAQMRRHANKGVGIITQMSKKQQRAYIASIEAMIRGNKKLNFDVRRLATQIQTTFQIATNRMKVMWQSTMAFMSKAGAKFGKAMGKIMSGLGFIGIIVMIKELVEQGLKAMGFLKEDEAVAAYAEKVENLTERLSEASKEFETFAKTQTALRTSTVDGKSVLGEKNLKNIESMGKMIGQLIPDILEMNALLANPVEFESVRTNDLKNLQIQVLNEAEYNEKLKQVIDEYGFGRMEVKRGKAGNKMKDLGFVKKGDERTEQILQERIADASEGSLMERYTTKQADTVLAKTEMLKNLKLIEEGLVATGLAATEDGKKFQGFLDILKEGEQIPDDQVKTFEALNEKLVENGVRAAFIAEQQKEVDKRFTQTKASIGIYQTSVSSLLKLQQDQLKTLQQLKKDTEGYAEAQGRIPQLIEEINFVKQLRDIEIGYKNEKLRLDAAIAGANIGSTPMQQKEIARLGKLAEIDIKRNEIFQKMNTLKGSEKDLDIAKRKEYEAQLANLNFQTEALERQVELSAQLRDNMLGAAEGAVKGGLSDLIKGNEKSFKDAILKVAQTTLNAAADTLAESLTKGLFGKFFTSPSQKMLNAMKEGGTYAARQIQSAFEGKTVGSPDGLVKSGLEKVISGKTDSTENGSGNMEEIIVSGKGQQGIFGGFIDNLRGIFSGETPFLKGLQGIFNGALGGFESILGGLVDGLFGSGKTEGLFSLVTSLFGFASGGIMTPKGKVSGYSTGGIARGSQRGYPAILHGTEAVVPLPNGKSIPVNLKGETTQNNITVNVASDGRSTTQGSGGMDSEKLGKAIAAAVQAELHNQKRSGGILNPYGVA